MIIKLKVTTSFFLKILIFTVQLFSYDNLLAQTYYFRHYQVENGLSNNMVFCSAQDKNGFLWFGTKDGLNRFDGYHFKQFNITDNGRIAGPDQINCLLTHKKYGLIIGSKKGLYKFDTEKEKIIPLIDSLTDINGLLEDNKGQIWFIAKFILYRYNTITNSLQCFSPAKNFETTSICISADGSLWASTPDGKLQKFDTATQTFKSFNIFSHSVVTTSKWIQKIYPAGKDFIFIGTSTQGIKQFNTDTKTYTDLLNINNDKTSIYIRDIKEYSPNEFWFASESGIFIYNTISKKFTNLKKKILDPYSLSDNAVYSLCKDTEGGMWAGTYFGGINYYSKQFAVFQKYFPDDSNTSISGSAVREICEDQQNNIWIGTEDAGLNKLNPKTGAIKQFKPTGKNSSIAYTNIHGLLVVGNQLWIGTFEHGLDIMDIKSGKIIKHFYAGAAKNQLKSDFILSLLQTKSGDILIGSANSLFKYKRKSGDFEEITAVDGHLFISCLFEDHNKTIWVGTHDKGLYYFNPFTKEKGRFINDATNKNSIGSNIINAIFEDEKNNLWLSTDGGGLNKLNSKRKIITRYSITSGLPSNFIFKVLEDNNNNLWVSTSRGLAKFNPKNESVFTYTKDNGLLNDQFNYNSGYKNSSGNMYFGSAKGMITFNPNELRKPTCSSPVFITGFQVQNRELDILKDSAILKTSIIYSNSITLPYNRSSISIDFTALSYISPEMTDYYYYMKGLDKEWTTIKPNRKIYFTNLSPGNYTLNIKTGLNGNNSIAKQLNIIITPPWWFTTAAYLSYLFFIIGLSYYLLKSYHVIVQDKKEKEIYEAKIEFFTNLAHEIRTPLTLIKGPVENLSELVETLPQIKLDVQTMERNTNRLITLITQILDFRKAEAKGFSIDSVKVNISSLLREIYETFQPFAKKRNLKFTLQLPEKEVITIADEEALTKIFSNLLNNAIKYSFKSVDMLLIVSTENNGSFSIEFKNDGVKIPAEMTLKIFEPFYRLKDSLKHQGTGIGLALAKSLTELLNGKLYLKPDTGDLTIFVFYLPLKITAEEKKLK